MLTSACGVDAVVVREQPRGTVDDVVAGERDQVGVDPVRHVTPRLQPADRDAVTSSQIPTAW